MIALLIKCYLSILLSIGAGSLLLFIAGVYLIFKSTGKAEKRKLHHKAVKIAKSTEFDNLHIVKDVSAIAGEDPLATKLDLARAFIETGNKKSAKAILAGVSKQGNAAQKQEAKRLLQYT